VHTGELWRQSALTGLWSRSPQHAVLRPKCLALFDGAERERASVVVAVEDMSTVVSCEPLEEAKGGSSADVKFEFELRTRDHVRHRLRASGPCGSASPTFSSWSKLDGFSS